MTDEVKVYLDGSGSYYSSISGPRSLSDSFIPHPSQAMVTLLGENSKPIEADSFHEAYKTLADAGIEVGSEDQVTQLLPVVTNLLPNPTLTPTPILTPEETSARIDEALTSMKSDTPN